MKMEIMEVYGDDDVGTEKILPIGFFYDSA